MKLNSLLTFAKVMFVLGLLANLASTIFSAYEGRWGLAAFNLVLAVLSFGGVCWVEASKVEADKV